MENKNAKSLLWAAGVSLIAFLLFNLIAFGLKLQQTGLDQVYDFHYKHGIFHINKEAAGMVWGEASSTIFLLACFVAALAYRYRNGKISLDL